MGLRGNISYRRVSKTFKRKENKRRGKKRRNKKKRSHNHSPPRLSK
jgi:hypothetical protein